MPAEFGAGLLAAYEAEISGEAFFHALARRHRDTVAVQKLTQLARLERITAQRLAPVVRDLALAARDHGVLRTEGEMEAAAWAQLTWPETLARMLTDFTPYVDAYRELSSMAPPAHQPAMEFLVAHESALVECARRELAQDPDSLTPVMELLPEAPQ